ncbi:MAG: ATP-binding cassette domain-containing protein [Gammaproteobacteria bacterium]|nr:ATP-binding cassette domain-containing protein [Gammaproteobacteria bacterium]
MLLSLREVSLAYSQTPLLNQVNFQVDDGERVCLVGRNGAGKSSLMKIIAGDIEADAGERNTKDQLRVARLVQDVPHDISGTIYDVVTAGLGGIGELINQYEQAAGRGDSADVLLPLQQQIETQGGWDAKRQVDEVLSRMQLDGMTLFENLSGGLKRRVLLAQALASDPQLLLLDEPTNHLDIEAVQWLENFIRNGSFAVVFVTHDRAFLDAIATRIVEVDRGNLHNFPGRYSLYRERKAEQLEIEQKNKADFDKVLAEEEAWIRRGVKARTKRNIGRVKRLEDLREEADGHQKYQKRASIKAQMAENTGKRVIEAKNLSYSIAGKPLVKDFTLKILRGQKIGLMGPNGCGKTTLLRLLLGELEADSGTLIEGTNLQVGYFDQTRKALKLDKTAAWNVAEGYEKIDFDGRALHVLGYLKAFLFTPDRANSLVEVLSGGERNRLLLARLFAHPANVLVMDEPTNDLDVETLELLEDLVNNFAGTVLLVSHDRAFVNNVVDSLIVWDGDGEFDYFVGNYDDWLRQRKQEQKAQQAKAVPVAKPAAKKSTKLSYKLQRELDQLPATIEALEEAIEAAGEAMAQPEFFKQSADAITAAQATLAEQQAELENAYTRWEELEAQKNG